MQKRSSKSVKVKETILISEILSVAHDKWSALPEWVRRTYENGDLLLSDFGVQVKTSTGWRSGAKDDCLVLDETGNVYPCVLN